MGEATGSTAMRSVVERMYAAIDGNDADALVALMCADVVYERPGVSPLRGREANRLFYLHERKIPTGKHTLEHIAIDVDGQCGAAWGSFEGIRDDGKPVTLRFADVFTFHDGHVHTRRSHVF